MVKVSLHQPLQQETGAVSNTERREGGAMDSVFLGSQHGDRKDTIRNFLRVAQLPLIMVRPNVPLQTTLLPGTVRAKGARIGLLPRVSTNVPL